MKNRILSLMLIAVLLLCSACQSADTPNPTQPTMPSTPPETTVPFLPEPIYENMYSVSMPITTEVTNNDAGDIIFSYAYQTMHLIIPDSAVADKIIIDFSSRVYSTREDAQQLNDAAESNENLTVPYSYQIQYNPSRIDQGVLSLYGQIVQVNDATHAGFKGISASYDLVTGDVLTLGSILYHADSKAALEELVITALEKKQNISLYDDFRDSVHQRFARDESTDEDFYFTTTGLCFYFSPYEIAPFSSGNIFVEIPYNKLTGIIGDAYFPAERNHSQGFIGIQPFESADLETFEQFTEIVTPDADTKLLLTTDSNAQDIRIQRLIWDDDGSTYFQADTIFAANVLCEGDAILFEASFSDVRPTYCMSYLIDGQLQRYYFVKDAVSGDISITSLYTPQ